MKPRTYVMRPVPHAERIMSAAHVVKFDRDEGVKFYRMECEVKVEEYLKLGDVGETLGDWFDHTDDFIVRIRAPKGLQVVEPPKGFIGLLRGGYPPVELVVLGSAGAESLAEFQEWAISQLNTAQMGPAQVPEKIEDVEVATPFGSTFRMELFVRSRSPRNLSANSVPYNWLLYFAEEGPQKVMIGYVIPDARYEQFSRALQQSLETLALSSKFSDSLARTKGEMFVKKEKERIIKVIVQFEESEKGWTGRYAGGPR